MNAEVKELLDRANAFCMACEEQSGAACAFGIQQAMREVLKMDLTVFLLALSNADGIPAKAEADFINELLGWEYDVAFLDTYVCDVDCEQNIPMTLRVFALYDKVEQPEESAAKTLIDLFVTAGKALSEADNMVVRTESSCLMGAIDKMESYVKYKLIKTNRTQAPA